MVYFHVDLTDQRIACVRANQLKLWRQPKQLEGLRVNATGILSDTTKSISSPIAFWLGSCVCEPAGMAQHKVGSQYAFPSSIQSMYQALWVGPFAKPVPGFGFADIVGQVSCWSVIHVLRFTARHVVINCFPFAKNNFKATKFASLDLLIELWSFSKIKFRLVILELFLAYFTFFN